MNDMYAKDISRKIKSVKRDKQRRGQFIGGKPAFGYRMHPTEKNRIIIDENAAKIVRQIFSMALSGTSCRQIAAVLNRENIPSPSVYAKAKNTGRWSGERISEMLQNEIYLGNMVQGRRVKVSYKSKKSLRQKKENWIVVNDTHEAIIDSSTFESIQRILASRRRTRSRTYDFPLKGLIFCHECGHPLGVVNRRNAAGEDVLYFVCRTYQRSSDVQFCSSHCVKVSTITDAVNSELHKICKDHLSPTSLLPIAQRVLHDHTSIISAPSHSTLTSQLERVATQIDNVYLDRLNNLIEQADFERIYRSLCQKRQLLEQQITAEKDLDAPQDPDKHAAEMVGSFLSELPSNRDFLAHMIEKVELTKDKQVILILRISQNTSG